MAEWPLQHAKNKFSGSGQSGSFSRPQIIVVFDANSVTHYC